MSDKQKLALKIQGLFFPKDIIKGATYRPVFSIAKAYQIIDLVEADIQERELYVQSNASLTIVPATSDISGDIFTVPENGTYIIDGDKMILRKGELVKVSLNVKEGSDDGN